MVFKFIKSDREHISEYILIIIKNSYRIKTARRSEVLCNNNNNVNILFNGFFKMYLTYKAGYQL
jgi:hypothetical protein